MTKQIINIGQAANDKKGDSLRAAFQKVNANFNELYVALGLDDGGLNLGSFKFEGSTLSTTDSTGITISQTVNITSNLTLSADLLPNESDKYELGSNDSNWNKLWLGSSALSINDQGRLLLGTDAVVTDSLAFSGSYTDLTNKPVIPTVPTTVSAFTNDSGYITQADIAGGNLTIDLATTGTVVADVLGEDSTLLVDSQASKLTGPVDTFVVENSRGDLNLKSSDNVIITSGGNSYQWTLDNQGRLVVPPGGDIVRNGVSFSSVDNILNVNSDLQLPNGILFPNLQRFQVVNPPSTLEGSPGDSVGMLAFDANKIYFCKEPYTRQGSYAVTIDGLPYSDNVIRITSSSIDPQPGWTLSDVNFTTTIISVVPNNGGYDCICDAQAPQDPWRTGSPYNVTLTDTVLDSGNIWVSQNWLTDLDLLEIVNETIKTIENNVPIELQTQGADSTVHRWRFDAEGVLTLPNASRITEKTVITDGSLRNTVEVSPGSISQVTQSVRFYPSNPVGESNVHVSSGDLSATALVIGNEDQYFKISTNGDLEAKPKDNQNLKITVSSTSNSITTPKEWNFTAAGELKFPDNTFQTTAFNSVNYRNILIVDPNGNNSTADGSINRPFATIQAAHDYAQTNIPAASDAVIHVNPGAYSENITITRVKTHIVGTSPGSSLSTTITGRILINVSTGNQGVTNDTITLERIQIVNNIDNVLILGGVQRYTFIGKNLDITNGGNTLRAISITNTNSSGIALQLEDCVVDNSTSSDTAIYISSVFDGKLRNVRISSGSGSALDLVNSSVTLSDSEVKTASGSTIINITSSFGTPFNPLTAPNGSIALTARNISLVSTTINGTGVSLAANSTLSITDSKFRIPSGTGKSINGVSGSYLISSGLHFHPASNSDVAQDVTVVPNSSYLGTISRIVFSDNSVQTTAYTGGSGGPNLTAVDSNIIPDTDEAYDLGSSTFKFRDLYLSGNTIYLGGTSVSIDGNGNLLVGGSALADVGTAAWENITGKPTLSAVATSGSYTDLSDQPTIPLDLSDLTDTSSLLTSVQGNFNFNGNTLSSSNGSIPIIVSIFGADNNDPPALISRKWSFDTDGSFNFLNPFLETIDATITVSKISNWDTAYSWGDHSTAGYLTQAEVSDVANIARNIESENDVSIRVNLTDSTQRTWRFGEDGDLTFPDGTSQTTAFTGNAATVDITNTNGIDTNYSITFVENRDGAEILRADVDLTFNSATNTLTTGNVEIKQTLTGGILESGSDFVITSQPNPDRNNACNIGIYPGFATDTASQAGFVSIQGGSTDVVGLAGGDVLLRGGSHLNSGISGTVTVQSILKIDDGVHEKFQALADATGVVTHDCASGHIFYHTSPDANWTVNLTNINLITSYATNVAIVITQGGTGYYPSAVQIGGAAQTIKWLGNVTPTPQANKTEIATFTIFNNSGTYTVLGSYSSYG